MWIFGIILVDVDFKKIEMQEAEQIAHQEDKFGKPLVELDFQDYQNEYKTVEELLFWYLTLKARELHLVEESSDPNDVTLAFLTHSFGIVLGFKGEYEDILLSDLYKKWFSRFLVENPACTLQDFVDKYGVEKFPGVGEELFKQIVPQETVDGFLRKCLNGRATAIGSLPLADGSAPVSGVVPAMSEQVAAAVIADLDSQSKQDAA